jgi:hypothetical protein
MISKKSASFDSILFLQFRNHLRIHNCDMPLFRPRKILPAAEISATGSTFFLDAITTDGE